MRTSNRGIELIKAHEGLRLDAYPDPAKGWEVPTIGYGHTTAAGPPVVKRGMRITAQEADAILRGDVVKVENYVTILTHVPLTQNQFDALVSFTFNLGPGNLERSTLRKKLNAGDYKGAADEFHSWKYGGGKVMPGLVKRRAAEARLFMEPVVAHTTPEPTPVKRPPTLSPLPTGNTETPRWLYIIAAIVIGFAAFQLIGG